MSATLGCEHKIEKKIEKKEKKENGMRKKLGDRDNGVLCTHTVHEIANSKRQEMSIKWARDELHNGHKIHSLSLTHSAAECKNRRRWEKKIEKMSI